MKNMIFKQLAILSVFTLLIISCDKNDDTIPSDDDTTLSPEEVDQKRVNDLYNEIVELSESKQCTNSDDWRHTSYGSKACGGPVGYLPYSIQIDSANFFNKINEHRTSQGEYNKKYGAYSTCDISPSPTEILCTNGKATLLYDNEFHIEEPQ